MSKNQIEVKKIVLIATPNGGWKIVPRFIYSVSSSFSPAQIFIIAGDKRSSKWYLEDQNDGAVDLSSALSVKAEDKKIFNLNHEELILSESVVNQIKIWISF